MLFIKFDYLIASLYKIFAIDDVINICVRHTHMAHCKGTVHRQYAARIFAFLVLKQLS